MGGIPADMGAALRVSDCAIGDMPAPAGAMLDRQDPAVDWVGSADLADMLAFAPPWDGDESALITESIRILRDSDARPPSTRLKLRSGCPERGIEAGCDAGRDGAAELAATPGSWPAAAE